MRKVLTLLGLSLVAVSGLEAQSKNPSLAGTWKYDAARTKEAEAKPISDAASSRDESGMRRSNPSSRARGSGGGGAGSSGGGMGGGGAGSAGGAEPAGGGAGRMQGPLGMYARPLPELIIEQTDTTVSISDVRGTPRVYRTDGKKQTEPLLGSDTLEVTAKWKDGKLTTERKLGSYGTIRETYRVDPEAHELIIDVKLTGGQGGSAIELRRIYVAPTGGF
jgi:hypothetical protein